MSRAVHLRLIGTAIAAMLGATSANASLVTFNFSDNQADAASYTFTDAATGLVLTITPATFVGSSITQDPSYLVTQDTPGLGVRSSGDGEPLFDAKKNGLQDMAIFSFSDTVSLTQIAFNNTDSANDTFDFFHDSDNNNSLVNAGTNSVNHPSGLVLLSVLFPGLATGDLFGFGSACGGCPPNNEWRISSLSVDVAVTPLPAALPLFGTGLGVFALVRWFGRRRSQAV